VQRSLATAIVYLLAAVADSWLLIAGQPLNQPSKLDSVLCFVAAILFGLGAELISRRPNFAHRCAVAGIVALPWIYTAVLQGNIYTNEWILLNVPDRELRMYMGLARAELAIIAVAMIVFAIGTGILRLLPGSWVLRKKLVRERTWPAAALCFGFLGVWFSQSAMPYRIPGAVDYSSWPILQILHVQKHGLQFHETCLKVGGYRGFPQLVSFSWNDRRLFEFRFQERLAHVEVSKSVEERITALIQSSKTAKSNRELIGPLRRWDDEGWYVWGEEVGFTAYTKENQATPPQEVVDLFHDLEKIPRTNKTSEDRKDVCLGFCYDPVSELGALYANHRCSWEGSHVVCR
jgi:hypothetical protein